MGILKGIIDRFRAMGKSEKEISGIIETAADKATANPDVTKPEKQKEPEMKIETTAEGSLRQFCKWERLCNRQKRQL